MVSKVSEKVKDALKAATTDLKTISSKVDDELERRQQAQVHTSSSPMATDPSMPPTAGQQSGPSQSCLFHESNF